MDATKQDFRDWLAFAKPRYAYPANLQVVAMSCKTPNAFYLLENEMVVFCYELTERLIHQYQNALSNGRTTEQQALQRLLYSVHYVLQHELGYATLHNRRAKRNFGSQESEADNFAAVSLILSARNDAVTCLAAGANATVAQQFVKISQFTEAGVKRCQFDCITVEKR